FASDRTRSTDMSDSTPLREEHFDLVVAGTGAAGMAAALRATTSGARVALLEKSTVVGGTTAISGGVVWAPGNDHARAAGVEEDLASLLGYMRRASQGRAEETLLPVYARELPRVIRFVEESLGFTFEPLLDYPDYQPELPGGRAGGRSLDNPLYDTKRLGDARPLLRRNLVNGMVPITIGEAMRWRVFSNPFGLPYKEVAARGKDGIVHGGAALIGRFLEALLAAGVRPRTEHAAEELVVEDGRVVGLVARTPEGRVTFRADKGVVLASGGFEWSPELRKKFLPIELSHPL